MGDTRTSLTSVLVYEEYSEMVNRRGVTEAPVSAVAWKMDGSFRYCYNLTAR